MKCSECKHLDLSTPLNRRKAAIGYAECALGLRPRDEGYPNLQAWPTGLFHNCPKGVNLSGKDKEQRMERLKKLREYLEGKR